MTPAEEVRAAVAALRAAIAADEPVGICEDCGVRVEPEPDTAALRAAREPLAEWMGAVAGGWERADAAGLGKSAGRRADHPALALARAIVGGPTVWDDSVPPGGQVCAAEVAPGRICGTPVESEPCRTHGGAP